MKPSIFTDQHQLNIEALQDILTSFYHATEVPVTLYDAETSQLWNGFAEKKICRYFNAADNRLPACKNALRFSAAWAKRLGEPYIFVCPSGFVNIAIALLDGDTFAGSVIAGPIAMGPIEESTIRNLFSIHDASPEVLYSTTLFIKNMKLYTPTQVNHLAKLLNAAILSLYPSTENYETLSSESKIQTAISEQIHEHKKRNIPLAYPYEKEQELVRQIKVLDTEGAQTTLKYLFNEILLIESGKLEIIKARVLELVTILSRAAVEGGASLEKIFGLNLDLITELNAIDSINVLSSWVTKIIDHFSKNIFNQIYSGDSYLISQALEHTHANYMNKLTLKKLSDYLHVSESYLSKLFKRETGTGFTQYLNEIRIKHSQELLTTTKMSIVEVALYVGYEDQSYFTKVFKRQVGLTPKKYRSQHFQASAH